MKPTQSSPNVIFVITDDQGYGDLGCHGNPILKTPCLDAFHDQSTRFTDFHVGPTCAPTRSGLHTGHYANSTGVWHTIGGRSLLRGNETTLASALADHGYRTGLFGKWHLGDNAPYRPQDRGFQHVVCHGGGGISQLPDYWGNDYFDDHYSVNGEMKPFEGYCTDVFFREAMSFIEDSGDQPFFCTIATNAPHGPYNVDRPYSAPYLETAGSEARANFYGMIANIDENFGKLVDFLDRANLAENTLLIFMTDNGTSCSLEPWHNAGMRGQKGSQYDGGHRVPFFLRGPETLVGKPRDIDTLTANVDFMPTILDLCGIDLAEYDHCKFHGQSLRPLLNGHSDSWPERAIVTDSQRVPFPIKWRQSAVLTQRWRLINGNELYDIQADPAQQNDVADEHAELVGELRREYEKWWELVSVQFEEAIPIAIGDPREPVACLTSHDWRPFDERREDDPQAREHNDYLSFSQRQIRTGNDGKGYFEINVARPGRYRLALRRWPAEEDRAITAGIEPSKEGWRSEVIEARHESMYSGGVALPITKAGIDISGIEQEVDVAPDDKTADFTVELKPGETRLSTWFRSEDGEERGAYYVYVSLIEAH